MIYKQFIKNIKKNNFGFSLIELIVTIGIIIVLSGVILVSVKPAREKSRDARIIADLNQLKAIAESLYDGDYDAFTINHILVLSLSNDISKYGGQLYLKISPPNNSQNYRIYSKLNGEGYYCIDSNGFSDYINNINTNNPFCLNTNSGNNPDPIIPQQ